MRRRLFVLWGFVGALWVMFAGEASADIQRAPDPVGSVQRISIDESRGILTNGCVDEARAITFSFTSTGIGSVRIEVRESGNLIASILENVSGGKTNVTKLKTPGYDGPVQISVEGAPHIGLPGTKLVESAYTEHPAYITQESCAKGIVPSAERSVAPSLKTDDSSSQRMDILKTSIIIAVVCILIASLIGLFLYWRVGMD